MNDILSGVALTDAEDRRSTPFTVADGGALITSGLYKMIKSSRDQPQQMDNSFWRSCAPPRIQFFAWLVLHGRLQCKTNLFKKKIVDNVTCEVCGGAPETTEHLLFFCPFSDRLAAPRRSTGRRCHCPRPPPPPEAGKSTAGSLRHLCPAVLLAAVEAA